LTNYPLSLHDALPILVLDRQLPLTHVRQGQAHADIGIESAASPGAGEINLRSRQDYRGQAAHSRSGIEVSRRPGQSQWPAKERRSEEHTSELQSRGQL